MGWWNRSVDTSVVNDTIIKNISVMDDDTISLTVNDNGVEKRYTMTHHQDCCEHVRIEKIIGPTNLDGAKIYSLSEDTLDEHPS